ncbi:phosphatidylinositide phosphatase SAC1 isoform X2 [Zootermopsis nevadensis]|uniref:Phosphatidylinositol-3-phosphatase SAC1 n=2 Tax=Zootermopsis nevadensis TaxID=136037 RepID=A0A067RL58_ZOONE|nr:phosphatidylinositide phosphatase SAC1 isoform X2 [Zootermopsis nevadensis]XP_021918336.1 phosphatidylinositide phosphatase SAC1 isoform X2 [Zootermopsis nevadensis]KDR20269.1 Phosphatidylinositide phosphatase SAC1-B [Zootermopsis nevadensis]
MATVAELYTDFILYITPEKFYIEAIGDGNELLVIDRVSQEISLQVNYGQIPQASSSKPICGIVGTLQLLAGPYLVIITKKDKVGTINGETIWKVAEIEVISYTRTLLHLTEKQISKNKLYISMVENVLNTPFLYFSYSYDITHTQQRLHNTTPEFLQMPYHERADLRFVWNGHLLRELTNQPELSKFCLPLLHGFISINQCSLNGKPFLWTVVSRRCCFRAGTRLFTRGIDVQGNVANFVETEQIVEFGGDRSSFVQTRGSIPLFWNQLPNLKLKPKPRLIQNENHAEAFSRHFDTQIFNYGRQVLINLIDHQGAEGILEESYSEMVNQLGNANIRYESFDFHAECRHLRWDRLRILTDRLAHEQDEFGCFLLTRDGTLVSLQDGVFRTNCIDCLDRTNVVQTMLARRSLTQIMQKLGILRAGQKVEDHLYFEPLFKSVWADNADILSTEYSGTGALKTDFTRTGKRTRWGLIRDAINSLARYYKNNFADGFRQDSIDLFLGRYMVEEGEGVTRPCPLDVEKGWKYITFPLVLLIAIAMFFANVFTPSEYTTESLLYLLFWGSMVAVTFATIMIYGTEFVDYPKLCEIR